MKNIVLLSEISKGDVQIAGGKGANLAELYNSKFPVPDAFIITAGAFKNFLEKTNLNEKIPQILLNLDIENTEELEKKAREIQELIKNQEMPPELKIEIEENYDSLSLNKEILEQASDKVSEIINVSHEPVFVAVRSSATTEDLENASFAGQQETFLNIKGKEKLIEAIKDCWASLFTARAIYYREKRGFSHKKSLIAVIVQKMVNADKAGVIFTVNPLNNKQEIVIECVFGLGEGVVSGTIEPDHYVIDKKTLKAKEVRIGEKKVMFIRDSDGKTKKIPLSKELIREPSLNEIELRELSEYAIKIENHYGLAQDIEFAIERNQIYIVQSRPITTLGKKFKEGKIEKEPILTGLGGSPGIASGKVKIVENFEDLKKIQKGDILVTKMTNPDMVVTMQKSSAIITDEGGVTCHAVIVSRELGIPCVVATRNATSILKDEQIVTVDGFSGKIYEGKIEVEKIEEIGEKEKIKTRTKIKVIVDLPIAAEKAGKTNADGIGLLRLEGIIAESGKHPFYYIQHGKIEEYKKILEGGIRKIAEKFPDKPIWIRTSDIRSDEYKHLEGSDNIKESNPMMGWHGIRRSLDQPILLKAELNAIKKLCCEFKLGVMFPQIISVEEIREIKKIASELNIKFGKNQGEVEFGIMVETPAACMIIEEICKEGIDFISFGTNDLTQFTLAVDRNNERVQKLYDEMHPAVLREITEVIKICKKYGIETSICGQAGSREEMVKFLVKQGIDSISANIDSVFNIRKIVAETEREIEKTKEKTERKEKEEKVEGEEKEEKEMEKDAEILIQEVKEEELDIF